MAIEDDFVGDGQAMLRLLFHNILVSFVRLVGSGLWEKEVKAGTSEFLVIAILLDVLLFYVGLHHSLEIGSATGLCRLNLLSLVDLVNFVLNFFPFMLNLTLASLVVDLAELESNSTLVYLLEVFVDFVAVLQLLSVEEAFFAFLLLLVAFEERCFVAGHEFGPLRDLLFCLGGFLDCSTDFTVVQHARPLHKLSVTDLRKSCHFVIVLPLDRLHFCRLLPELRKVGPHGHGWFCGNFRGFLYCRGFFCLACFGDFRGRRLLKSLVLAQLRHFCLVV